MDTNKYKEKLEEEMANLVVELEKIAFRDDENPNDWVPRRQDQNISDSEAVENFELAEEIEEYEKNTATVKELEDRLNDIKGALERIEKGTFGVDEVDGSKLEADRLNANPAARSSVSNAPYLERQPKTENEID